MGNPDFFLCIWTLPESGIADWSIQAMLNCWGTSGNCFESVLHWDRGTFCRYLFVLLYLTCRSVIFCQFCLDALELSLHSTTPFPSHCLKYVILKQQKSVNNSLFKYSAVCPGYCYRNEHLFNLTNRQTKFHC